MKRYLLLTIIVCLAGCDSSEERNQRASKSLDAQPRYTNVENLNQLPLCEKLELRLSCESAVHEQGALFNEKVEIINYSTNNVSLVFPGDGSEFHWRTPLTGVSILPMDSKAKHPNFPPPSDATCGNINSLKNGEVFILKPGEKREIDMWRSLFPVCNLPPGEYRLILYYANNPTFKWEGIPLGKHDEDEMGKIRKSTPCKLMSNEIVFTITENPDRAEVSEREDMLLDIQPPSI